MPNVVDIASPQSIIVETKGKNLEKYLSSEKKMKTKVLEAIELALEIKESISLSELASIIDGKKLDVLKEIAKNKSLLKLDKKGNITGFANVRDKQLKDKFRNGEVYSVHGINYGADRELVWNDSRAEELKVGYWEGGFGDCREIKVILDTEANRKLLENLGVIEITSAKTEPIEFFWEN